MNVGIPAVQIFVGTAIRLQAEQFGVPFGAGAGAGAGAGQGQGRGRGLFLFSTVQTGSGVTQPPIQ